MDSWITENSFSVESLEQATHYCYNSAKYFRVDHRNGPEFIKKYCELLKRGVNPAIYEVTKNSSTIILCYEIKLSFWPSELSKKGPEDVMQSIDIFVQALISIIQKLISAYFEVSEENSEYTAAYFKPFKGALDWKSDNIEYTGRIIFPYCHLTKDWIDRFYTYVINQAHVNKILFKLLIQPKRSLENIVTPYAPELFEMYGSYKNTLFVAAALYGRIDADIADYPRLASVFDPSKNILLGFGFEVSENELEDYLPAFYSNYYFAEPLVLQSQSLPPEEERMETPVESSDSLERVRMLLGMISRTRYDYYWSWYDIGNALHTICPTEEGLELWIAKTRESDVKGESDCRTIWDLFENHNVTIATLEWFASLDSPREYQEMRGKEIMAAVSEAAEEKTHKTIAKAFHIIFPHTFLCSSFETSKWYFYSNNHWSRLDGSGKLMEYLNEEFQAELMKYREKFLNEKSRLKDKQLQLRYEKMIANITLLVQNISEHYYKRSLCDELKIYYKNSSFHKVADLMGDFIATPSGIIDIRGGGEAILREGKPEDFCTRFTKQPYKEYSKTNEKVLFVKKYMQQLFRSKPLRKYVKALLGAFIRGTNVYKIFPFFNGSGDNSKSALVRTIESSLGSYCAKLPITLLTGKKGSADSPTPALIHAQGAHVVFMQEAGPDAIKSERAKEIVSGGFDTIMVRDLFQKGEDIRDVQITYIPIIVTNKFPVVSDTQEAFWNRVRVINFSSKWTMSAPEGEQDQMEKGLFKVDRHFEEKIKKIAGAFLYMMVHYYNKYTRTGFLIKEPLEVLEATEKYRISNNMFVHFTSECIQRSINLDGDTDFSKTLSLDDIFDLFKVWYTAQGCYRGRIPTKSQFKGELEAIWKCTADNNIFKGVIFNVEKVQEYRSNVKGTGSLLY